MYILRQCGKGCNGDMHKHFKKKVRIQEKLAQQMSSVWLEQIIMWRRVERKVLLCSQNAFTNEDVYCVLKYVLWTSRLALLKAC